MEEGGSLEDYFFKCYENQRIGSIEHDEIDIGLWHFDVGLCVFYVGLCVFGIEIGLFDVGLWLFSIETEHFDIKETPFLNEFGGFWIFRGDTDDENSESFMGLNECFIVEGERDIEIGEF